MCCATGREGDNVRPGHPFETSELDELRADQRRALRLIPVDVFLEHAPAVGPDVDNVAPVDRPMIETSLRTEAKGLLRELTSLLNGWRHYTQLETLDAFYQSNRAAAEQLDVRRQTTFFDQLEMAGTAHREAEMATPRVEDAPALRRLLFLLVWADGLSDYRDPRFASASAASAVPRERDERIIQVPAPPARRPSADDDDATELLAPADLP
ncbi:MAG: hypothetical protein QOI95_738 [Acidimicrobiaceae bacterium]|jgi:hypothetical protein